MSITYCLSVTWFSIEPLWRQRNAAIRHCLIYGNPKKESWVKNIKDIVTWSKKYSNTIRKWSSTRKNAQKLPLDKSSNPVNDLSSSLPADAFIKTIKHEKVKCYSVINTTLWKEKQKIRMHRFKILRRKKKQKATQSEWPSYLQLNNPN